MPGVSFICGVKNDLREEFHLCNRRIKQMHYQLSVSTFVANGLMELMIRKDAVIGTRIDWSQVGPTNIVYKF